MGADAAISLAIALLNNAGAISAAVAKAQSEGRELSADDWKAILDRDDLAVAQANAVLARAKAAGR
jgi:hypothetical protein